VTVTSFCEALNALPLLVTVVTPPVVGDRVIFVVPEVTFHYVPLPPLEVSVIDVGYADEP
jgi:hypothetical protein